MLAGRPPLSITPPEGPSAGVPRTRDRLAELTQLRPSVPPEVASVVARLLAINPDDRFGSAGELIEALKSPANIWTPRSLLTQRQRRRWGVGLVAAALMTGVLVWRTGSGAVLDPALYVIVPFAHRGGAAPTLLSGDQCELLLREAFERWSGVRLVDEFKARDVRLRHGDSVATLADAFVNARELHSGLMLWGEVDSLGDSIVVRAMLYDVANGRLLRHQEIRLNRRLDGLADRFNALADSLLLGLHAPGAASGTAGTKNLDAWYAYQRGHDALSSWDLAGADSAFREAVGLDPAYPHANFWLAQVREWRGLSGRDWKEFIAVALATPNGLSPIDRQRALALQAMAAGSFPQACAEYQTLLKRDSLDFLAWYGLGDCHARDRTVMRDPRSPTHWGFRGSYQAAVDGYTRALRINSAVHRAFRGDELDRLGRLLFTEMSVWRAGVALAPDTIHFGAFPSLDHDTLAFVPFPLEQWARGGPEVSPATQRAAVTRAQEELLAVTTAWVRALPQDADALEAQAVVLETMGLIRRAGSDERSAIEVITRARQTVTSREQALRLAIVEIRLRLKLEQYDQVKVLADSQLAAFGDAPPLAVAGPLARLAVLTGRVARGASLLPRSTDEDSLRTVEDVLIPSPPAVLEASLALLVYSAVGSPVDSIKALRSRIDRAVDRLVEPTRRTVLRRAALDLPAVLAFPQLGVGQTHRSRAGGLFLMELQWALARGDTATVRAGLARAFGDAQQGLPGDIPIDFAYQYAELALAVNDSSMAQRFVSEPLDALPTLSTKILDLVAQSGGITRAMMLRADLAARAGDQATARHWADAVVTLWADADPSMQPALDRMRRLASPGQGNR